MLERLEKGQKVRFTEEWLSRCTAEEQRRMRGRIGQVDGYRAGANEPIVFFPKFGRFKELRLFEVNPRHLERLANP